MMRRIRRRGEIRLFTAMLAFGVLAVIAATVQTVEHPTLPVVTIAVAVVAFWAGRRLAFWAGRRYEGRPRRKHIAVKPPEPPTQPLPKVPHLADQVAELERAAGRPIEAIIASYQMIQRKYGGQP